MIELGALLLTVAAVAAINNAPAAVDALGRYHVQRAIAARLAATQGDPSGDSQPPPEPDSASPATGAPPIILGDSFGRRVKAARAGLGMSTEQLAHSSGVSRHTLHRIDRDEYEPSRGDVLALAEALNVPADALLPSAGVVRS